jgi:predicted lipoprotein with Yx(FWY)xxD motif
LRTPGLTALAAAVAVAAFALLGAKAGDAWTPAGMEAAVAKPGAEATEATTGEQATSSATRRTKVRLKRTRFGRVLFDSEGYALYLFTRDGRKSKCNGDCASAWPPLRARGRLVGGKGVKDRLLGKVTRRDGTKQVTYNGHPLYNYIDDPHGVVLCQNVEEFGGLWYVVKRSGRPVR